MPRTLTTTNTAIALLTCLVAVCTQPVTSASVAAKFQQLRNQRSQQTDAVTQLAVRLLKKDAGRFTFAVVPDSLLPRHQAVITNTGPNSVKIVANSGVAAAWALHYYITRYCSGMVTWTAAQVSLPPNSLPKIPNGQLNITSQDVYTAMPNVCTFSYSYTWWQFADWEQHIDWMALHGINLAYSLTGQERVFRNVFLQFGLSDLELDAFFPGPAFLAWGRMGNLKAWAGPLPAAWYDIQANLQKQILQRMTSLGMVPVLQGFSGIVPDAFIERYPHVNYSRLSNWNYFGKNYSEVVLLDPKDPMFLNVSMAVIKENVKVFGQVTHHYAMDPFNEVVPSQGDPDYLKSVSSAIFNGLKKADPNGVWVLQNWFLTNDGAFWTANRTKAFLSSVEKGHLLIIDLWAEMTDSAHQYDGFYGHDFLWMALHNFGGNTAMFGNLPLFLSHGPFELRQQYPANMLGSGILPEGIDQNEVVYELVMEFNWRSEPPSSLGEWIRDYARRRYGRDDKNLLDAWSMLLTTVYNGPKFGQLIPVLIARPSLKLSENSNYNTTVAEAAWRLLIATNETGNILLNYDQVDLTRQMLQTRFYQYYQVLTKMAEKQNATAIESTGRIMVSLLDSMNELLKTDEHFLLQKLINEAKSFAKSDSELALYELNVRNQLTCWGPGPFNIEDYAARMYNGLISGYYRPRWALFVQELVASAQQKVPFNEKQFIADVFAKIELPFYTDNSTTGPAVPTGSPYSAVKQVEKSLPPVPTSFLKFTKESQQEDDLYLDWQWLLSQISDIL